MSGYSNNTHDYVYFNNNKKKIFIKARELNKKKITKNKPNAIKNSSSQLKNPFPIKINKTKRT